MRIRFQFDFAGKDLRFYFGIFNSRNAWKHGITNRCKDGKFVIFLDYDNVPLEWILDELTHLMPDLNIGDTHIFKTGKGYHVVNTEKRSFAQILNIMHMTSADPNYINVPLKYGKKTWTLRISHKKGKPKIRYLFSLKGTNRLEQSNPHNELIRRIYGVRIRRAPTDRQKHFYKSAYPVSE